MKRRLLSILLCVCMALTLLPLPAAAIDPARPQGAGTSVSPYEISSSSNLLYLAAAVNSGDASYTSAHYKLTNNIDLSGIGNWTPIGVGNTAPYGQPSNAKPFEGTFDGNGNTISNLTINAHDKNYQGLFGYVESATIQNLVLTDCNVTGIYYVGSLVGVATSSTIANCSASGTVSGEGGSVGGIAGIADRSTLTNCQNACAVTGQSGSVGGIAGQIGGSILNCRNTGSVSGKNTVGGIAGILPDSEATMRNCYNTGVVSGNEYVGGIAGYNYAGAGGDPGEIAYCYTSLAAMGEITAPVGRADDYQGVQIGKNADTEWNAKMIGCGAFSDFSSGILLAKDYVGEEQKGTSTNPYVSGTTTTLVTALNAWARSPQGKAAGANFWAADGAPTLTTDPNPPVTPPTTGGSSSGDSDGGYTSNSITQPSGGNTAQTGGSVELSNPNAKPGDTVIITPKPEVGYELSGLTVRDGSGNVIRFATRTDGTYSFQMPNGTVNVTPTFSKIHYYADVPDSVYFSDAAWQLRKEGIMQGVNENTFSGQELLNRQQTWMITARINGQTPDSMATAKEWAVAQKVSDGEGPTSIVSRQQLATMMYRAAGSPTVTESKLNEFSDASAVAGYAKEAMNWAVDAGVLMGNNGMLNASSPATRANAAIMFTRYMDAVQK